MVLAAIAAVIGIKSLVCVVLAEITAAARFVAIAKLGFAGGIRRGRPMPVDQNH